MKKQAKKQQKRKQKILKASYIGVGAMVGIGVMGVMLSVRMLSAMPGESTAEQLVIPTMAPISVETAAPVSAPVVTPTSVTPTPLPTEVSEEQTVTVGLFSLEKKLVLQLPVEGKVLMPFSVDQVIFSKTLGDWQVHTGMDIEADRGTEVQAAATGTVEKTYLDPLMGHTVVLRHSDAFQTVYQNLASTEMVTVGQTVEIGDCVGAVGDSAPKEMLEENHLHFEVLKDGVFVNPLDYISG